MNRAEIVSPPVSVLIFASAHRLDFRAYNEARAHESGDVCWMLIAPGHRERIGTGGFAIAIHDSCDGREQDAFSVAVP
jgi:hypothetical protein